ncbi:hypothetical protein BGX38DRAFT_226934 [Terfezia claveryi]|nr:hypothetical protein BGX38DRAFT_226934 [Terfezia claveryi]
MGGAKKWIDSVIHSGPRKHGRDDCQQSNNQQSQLQERGSGKGIVRSTWRSLSPFTRTSERDHARPPSQSDTVLSGTLAPASGRIDFAASSTSLISLGQEPQQRLAAPPCHTDSSPPETKGLGGLDAVPCAHCPRPPPEAPATDIAALNPLDIVITTISLIDPSSQTLDPVSTPTNNSQALSSASQAVEDANRMSDTKNNPSTFPPSISSHIWQKTLVIAQKSLAKYQLPSVELGGLQSQSAAENIQFLVAELETAHQKNKDRQWRYKDRQGNEVVWVERLGRIMKSVDKYAKIVDTAIQHHPDITSLVWAGARTMLQVALNHVESMECFEATMATIMDNMAVSAFYAGIYTGVKLNTAMGDTGKLHEVLDISLPALYAAVIVFAVKARQYFDARWNKKAVNILKPFAIEFQPFIDDITGMGKTVQECADMATMERIRGSSEKIAEMAHLLIDIRADMKPLSRLNEISDALNENVKVSKEILKRSLRAEDEELLQLLSPLEPLKRHADVKSIRLENSGTWLLELECFRKWRDIGTTDGSGHILCCYGMPGAGKTMISSLVIDYLSSQASEQTTSKASVVCLYADYRDWNNQTLVHILGCFLHQLLTSADLLHVQNQVIEILKGVKKRNTKVELGDMFTMLKLISTQLDSTFFCIDALDELEPQTRRRLLDILSNELQLGTRATRLFLTGRPHMQSEVQSFFEIQQEQEVEIIAKENDIRQYLSDKIAKDRRVNPDAMNNALESEILAALVARSQGMFLLPTLHIDMVLEQATISKRRKALGMLPTELHDTFEGVVKRIQQSRGHSELGMKVLLWLHLAYRPLKLEELQHALAVEQGDTQFEVDNIPSRKALLDCCLGLVLIDEETGTVRFVHYSLEEHFRLQSSIYFPHGYSAVAETCLIYLNFPELREHSKTMSKLKEKLRNFPLLEYAACNWGMRISSLQRPYKSYMDQ